MERSRPRIAAIAFLLGCLGGPGLGPPGALAGRRSHGHGHHHRDAGDQQGHHGQRGREARAAGKAHELATRARLAAAQGRTADALNLYQQAFDLTPAPAYLLAIADSHKDMGNAGRAAFFYRRYLGSDSAIENRAEVEDVAQRLEALAAEVRKVASPAVREQAPVAPPVAPAAPASPAGERAPGAAAKSEPAPAGSAGQ